MMSIETFIQEMNAYVNGATPQDNKNTSRTRAKGLRQGLNRELDVAFGNLVLTQLSVLASTGTSASTVTYRTVQDFERVYLHVRDHVWANPGVPGFVWMVNQAPARREAFKARVKARFPLYEWLTDENYTSDSLWDFDSIPDLSDDTKDIIKGMYEVVFPDLKDHPSAYQAGVNTVILPELESTLHVTHTLVHELVQYAKTHHIDPSVLPTLCRPMFSAE